MTNTNDQRILELKKQIESKKEKLGKSSRFTPVTNCSLELDNVRINIQTLNKTDLTMLLIRMNSFLISSKDLGVDKDFKFSGYSLEEWITDIRSKLEVMSRKDEEKLLKSMEDKLLKLLSDGKKVELEINDIESMLNN